MAAIDVGAAPRVLVVDDEPAVCETIALFLSMAGYAVACAEDGEMAQRLIEPFRPDVIVADIFMPHQDGLGLINWLRQQALPTPVIVMSGRERSEDFDGLALARNLGAAATLAKPFFPRQLTEAITSAIGRA
jgi:DNA-binding response OmpR family regulator